MTSAQVPDTSSPVITLHALPGEPAVSLQKAVELLPPSAQLELELAATRLYAATIAAENAELAAMVRGLQGSQDPDPDPDSGPTFEGESLFVRDSKEGGNQ